MKITNQKNLQRLLAYLRRPKIRFDMGFPRHCLAGAVYKIKKKSFWKRNSSPMMDLQNFLGIYTREEVSILFYAEFSPAKYDVTKEETIKYLESLVTES